MKLLNRTIQLFAVIFISNNILYAQSNVKNDDNPFKPENQMQIEYTKSYKSISFLLSHVDNEVDEASLDQLLKTYEWFISLKYDPVTGKCNLETKVDVSKEELLVLLGTEKYKVSDYTEKSNLVIKQAVVDPVMQQNMEYVRANPDKYKLKEMNSEDIYDQTTSADGKVTVVRSKKSQIDNMTKEEKIAHIQKLRQKAVENGYPTDKYDDKLNELNNSGN